MIDQFLKRIAQTLDRQKIPYMVIGGQAVLLYGTPRFTRDIDITLGLDTDQFERIKRICVQLKLRMLPDNPNQFARTTKVLPAEEGRLGLRVDFIFSFTPYEQQAIKRTKKIKVRGYPVQFASAEDIIIHKIFAGRAIDEEDIRGILLKHKKEIDDKYIHKWLKQLENVSEGKDLPGKFEALYSED